MQPRNPTKDPLIAKLDRVLGNEARFSNEISRRGNQSQLKYLKKWHKSRVAQIKKAMTHTANSHTSQSAAALLNNTTSVGLVLISPEDGSQQVLKIEASKITPITGTNRVRISKKTLLDAFQKLHPNKEVGMHSSELEFEFEVENGKIILAEETSDAVLSSSASSREDKVDERNLKDTQLSTKLNKILDTQLFLLTKLIQRNDQSQLERLEKWHQLRAINIQKEITRITESKPPYHYSLVIEGRTPKGEKQEIILDIMVAPDLDKELVANTPNAPTEERKKTRAEKYALSTVQLVDFIEENNPSVAARIKSGELKIHVEASRRGVSVRVPPPNSAAFFPSISSNAHSNSSAASLPTAEIATTTGLKKATRSK